MDKSLQLVLVAAVALLTAAIVIGLVQSQSEGFKSFVGGQSAQAKCDLYKKQLETAEKNGNDDKVTSLNNKIENLNSENPDLDC